MQLRKLTAVAVAAVTLAVGAAAAQAAPRDLDPSFGGDGTVLTSIGTGSARANAVAREPDGRIVAAGILRNDATGGGNEIAVARYLPSGALDKSFGAGGIVHEQFTEDGTAANAVAIQPDGRILVAGPANFFVATVHVTRYLANGDRDDTFGDHGVAYLPNICCDIAYATGLAVAPGGKIVVGGFIDNTESQDSFVARLTSSGQPDSAYGQGGVTRLKLGDAAPQQSRALGLVLDDGRAVVAGDVLMSSGHRDVMLARLDDTGQLDDGFGDGGMVHERAGNDDDYQAEDVALWNGKLVVAGSRGQYFGTPRNYLLARFDAADGALDPSFNQGVGDAGWVFAGAGEGEAEAEALAVDPATGSVNVTGSALAGGKRKPMVVRYTSEGERDDVGFHSSDGHIGARLLDVGDGGQALGLDVLLDGVGRTVVAGSALDGGRTKFMLARLGDAPQLPQSRNHRPAARIRGHHRVPRKHWVSFHAHRSFDRDGRIVEYAWRTGDRPFRAVGPVFWHRFGRVGVHRLQLRVTDDDGARSVATFYVRVFKRRG